MKREKDVQGFHDHLLRLYQAGDRSAGRTVDALCWALDHPYCLTIEHEGCACGKPLAHLDADPDGDEWACRMPAPNSVAGSGPISTGV